MVNGFKGVNDLEWRENSQRHCFVIDVLVEPMCKYDMPAFTALAENNISTAICYGSANSNAAIYKAMTPNTYANVVAIDRFLIPLIKFPEKDDMIMSTNLLPVKLNKDIKKDYVDAAADLYHNEDKRESYSSFADTDNDGLYDFEEINFGTDLISFNDNDKVKLPTFAECLASTNDTNIITAMDIYADKSFYEKVMTKNVLLVNSDPTSEDGDGDGILDFDEVRIIKEELRSNASEISTFSATAINDSDGDGISDDVEIRNSQILDVSRKDTVESIYSDLKLKWKWKGNIFNWATGTGYMELITFNTATNPVYVFAEDNTIYITANMNYTGKENVLIRGKYYNAKDLIQEGIKERWESSFTGTEYDFYPGMEIDVKVCFSENKECTGTVTYDVHDYIARSRTDAKHWEASENRHVDLYIGDEGIKSYTLEQFKGAAAHEFGHVLGLGDAYEDDTDLVGQGKVGILPSSVNVGGQYNKKEKREIWCDITKPWHTYDCGEIMIYSGQALPNDIEMVLLAFSTNKKQWFSWEDNISDAIRDIQNTIIVFRYYIAGDGTHIEYSKINLENKSLVEIMDIPVAYDVDEIDVNILEEQYQIHKFSH